MRFLISLLNLRPGLVGGVETYVRHLLAELPEAAAPDQFTAVLHRDNAGSLPTPGMERVIVDSTGRQIVLARAMEAFTPFRARSIEKAFRRINADAAFFPQQTLFPKRLACPSVVTVVDVQHLFFPRYFGLFDKAFRSTIYPYSLRRANRLIAISEYTRQTVIQRCSVPPEKIVAIPFGVDVRDYGGIEPTKLVPPPYLYFPAATFPHKNHATLLRTFAALKKRGGFPYRLVLTGKQTKDWPALAALAAQLGIAADVIHPGFVAFEEVRRIYAGADAIVFPTRFEGFGIPIAEAVGFRKKVIASRLAVFDEIGLPRKWQIDFADGDQLLRALAQPGPTELEKPLWTWRQNAARTLDVLRRIARERSRR